MKRKSGFTLVELLVVIGIIALLISILLPSLNRVRWQASMTRCAAQMRDATNAVRMYTQENRGYFPPMRFNVNVAKATPDYWGSLWKQYGYYYSMAAGNSGSQNLADPKDDGALWGRLIKTGYLKSRAGLTGGVGSPYLCPNAVLDTSNASPWRSNYNLNPHLALRTFPTSGGGYYAEYWWKKIDRYGNYAGGLMKVGPYSGTIGDMNIPYFKRAMITDPIYDFVDNTHARGQTRAWNFAYADGSVTSFTTDKWASRATGNWQRLLDLSNALQHAADGGSVNFVSAPWQNGVYNALPVDPR